MSNINSTDPRQAFYPGATGLPPAPDGQTPSAGDAGGEASLEQLWSLLGTTAVSDVDETPATQGPRGNRTGASQAVANMGMPPVPKVKMTANTRAAYNAMAADMQRVMGSMPQSVQTHAATAAADPGAQPAPGKQVGSPLEPNFDADAVGANVADKLENALKGLDATKGDALLAFMILRLQNGSDNLKQLNELSQLSSDMQGVSSKQQIQKAQEADREAQKAQKKAKKLGIFSKLVSAIMAIVTVVVACVTLGAGLGLALVLAAMLITFVTTAAVKGAKNGKGFDVFAGLDMASMVGDGLLMAMGIGAAMMAVRTAIKTAAEEGTKAAVKAGVSAAQTASKTAAEVAGNSAGRSATQVAEEVVTQTATRIVANSAGKVTQEEAKGIARAALKGFAEKAGKQTAQDAGHSAAVGVGKTLATKGTAEVAQTAAQKMAAQAARKLTSRSIERSVEQAMIREIFFSTFKEAFKSNMKSVSHLGRKAPAGAAGAAAAASTPAATGASGAVDAAAGGALQTAKSGLMSVAKSPIMLNFFLSAGISGLEFGKTVMNAQVTHHQANADESMADAKLWKALYDVFEGSYKNIQDTMQHIIERHNDDVDAVQTMLNNKFSTSQMILNNMVRT